MNDKQIALPRHSAWAVKFKGKFKISDIEEAMLSGKLVWFYRELVYWCWREFWCTAINLVDKQYLAWKAFSYRDKP